MNLKEAGSGVVRVAAVDRGVGTVIGLRHDSERCGSLTCNLESELSLGFGLWTKLVGYWGVMPSIVSAGTAMQRWKNITIIIMRIIKGPPV